MKQKYVAHIGLQNILCQTGEFVCKKGNSFCNFRIEILNEKKDTPSLSQQ